MSDETPAYVAPTPALVTVVADIDFDGFIDGRRKSFTKGQTYDLPEDLADLYVRKKGLASFWDLDPRPDADTD